MGPLLPLWDGRELWDAPLRTWRILLGGIAILPVILYNEVKEKVEGLFLYCGLPLKYKE